MTQVGLELGTVPRFLQSLHVYYYVFLLQLKLVHCCRLAHSRSLFPLFRYWLAVTAMLLVARQTAVLD